MYVAGWKERRKERKKSGRDSSCSTTSWVSGVVVEIPDFVVHSNSRREGCTIG